MRMEINRNAETSVYLQIRNQLRRAIVDGILPEGHVLQPERVLAEKLGVNRSTVVKAYQELKADGLVVSRVGQGTVVLGQIFGSEKQKTTGVAPLSWYQYFSQRAIMPGEHIVTDMMAIAEGAGVVSFASGFPDPSSYPIAELRDLQKRMEEKAGSQWYGQSPVEGQPALRESLCRMMQNRQIDVAAKEVAVLSGSQQGLDLAARIFIQPGDAVLVEEPTFFGAIQIFRAAGARVIGVPIDQEGMRTDLLEPLILRHTPKLIYTLPTFQNPSGTTMSLARRRELLHLAYEHRVPIIEDDPYGELRIEGVPVPPLKALDRYGHVIYLSTFSKTLCLGFRVGWVVAEPEVLRKFVSMKQWMDLHTNTPSQWVLGEFLRQGGYERHLRRVCQNYRVRRDQMLKALENYHDGSGLIWNKPEGGYYIWCRMPGHITRQGLMAKSREERVAFLPGEAFYPDGTRGENLIRLNYTFPPEAQIDEGVKRLIQAMKRAGQSEEDIQSKGTAPVV